MSNSTLNDAERLVMFDAMTSLGIVAVDSPDVDVNAILTNMPDAEARKAKRKFRKLWRNFLRIQEKRGDTFSMRWCKSQGKPATRHQKRIRKGLVFDQIKSTYVDPTIKNLTR